MNNEFMVKDYGQYKYSLFLAKYFKTSLFNINEELDIKKFKKQIKINKKIYDKYVNDYLCSNRFKKNHKIISDNI